MSMFFVRQWEVQHLLERSCLRAMFPFSAGRSRCAERPTPDDFPHPNSFFWDLSIADKVEGLGERAGRGEREQFDVIILETLELTGIECQDDADEFERL